MQALFFSQPFTKSTSVRDFEHHLNQLQAAVNQSLASNKATPHFILEVIALLVQRYY